MRPTQAKALVALAEPAPYGLGTETLVDTAVRDTGQIPSELVTVEWNGQLDALLEGRAPPQAESPGPADRRLPPMLVYGRGQFFARHQDSEKHDGMVAALVVQLPAAHSGGEVRRPRRAVAHAIRREPARPDRRRPLRRPRPRGAAGQDRPSGHADLHPHPWGWGDDVRDTDPRAGDAATLPTRHFTTPGPGVGAERTGPPTRLVYLLDHQYTPRSLAWTGAQGVDIARTEALRASADLAGCEMLLALTDIHETWNTDDGPYARRRTLPGSRPRRPDRVRVTLTHWRGRGAAGPEEVSACRRQRSLRDHP